jgi:hypothetical protein
MESPLMKKLSQPGPDWKTGADIHETRSGSPPIVSQRFSHATISNISVFRADKNQK